LSSAFWISSKMKCVQFVYSSFDTLSMSEDGEYTCTALLSSPTFEVHVPAVLYPGYWAPLPVCEYRLHEDNLAFECLL
jgi:hypothetical protein